MLGMASVQSDRRAVGRYVITREIGRGAMATVYLARQTDLHRLVALKELSALSAADHSTARRFVRESRLAGSLNHPNIVTVHDFFEDRATPYIAMEYLDRGSLRPRIHGLTFAQIAGVLDGLLAGLAHAHERGIVHRDIKPENLMISAESRVKIADFGIAKATDEAQAGTFLTATGTTIGTPTYMAPEQAMAEELGPWSDLYAVGVIAFEMLGGRPPFDTTGTPMAVLLRHVNEEPLELSELDPSVDPRLSDWIAGLLAREPADRTRSAAAAWLALEEIVLDRLGSRWRREGPLDAVAAEPVTAIPTPATRPMAHTAARPQPELPTAMPRTAARVPMSAARPRRGVIALRRSLLLLAVVAVVTAALAMMPGHGSRSPGVPAGGSSGSPAVPIGTPATTPRKPSRGVGDSQSDDPSDDEEDGPEP
jgi:tRNA A-37 threonylcarbamoyl transferase component Bud32